MINQLSGASNFYNAKLNTTQSVQIRTLQETQREAAKTAEKIASGKKINTAADSASALAILEKMTAQWRGYDAGSSNIQDMQSAVNVADGALSSIGDDVARMQELTLKAANGTMTTDDRQMIQDEINQMQESIAQTAEYTQYNTQNLIDGSFQNKNVASDPSGEGLSVSIGNASPGALGLAGINVTGNDDSISAALDSISSASDKISSIRGDIGATSNRLDSEYAVNQQSSQSIKESASRIGDSDLAQLSMQFQQTLLRQQVGAYLVKSGAASAIDVLA